MRERSPRPPTLIPAMVWFLRRPLRAHGVGLTAALVCACAHAGPAQTTAPATWTNSLGMVFQQVPAGRFTMGGVEPPDTLARAYPALEARRFTELTDEGPAHTVHIRRAFYLGRHEAPGGHSQRFLGAWGSQPKSEADGRGTPPR